MSLLNRIPGLDEIMTQLDVQGAELQDSINDLLVTLRVTNDRLARLADVIEANNN